MTLLDAALAYAARGWRAFPLHGISHGACSCPHGKCSSPGKHPRVRHGLHEATIDPDRITRWWCRWPDANIAIATGAVSGIVVIDVDLRRDPDELDVLASMASLLDRGLPVTLTALTGGGGLHLFYATRDENLTNTASRLPGIDGELSSIDLRANGGYVVAPPSAHISVGKYEWLDQDQPIAPAPGWLKPQQRRAISLDHVVPAEFTGDGTPYGLAILRDELELVRSAPVGTRNDQLNRSAFALGQLVAGGEITSARVERDLLATAVQSGLTEDEVERTVASGLKASKQFPRVAPNRVVGV